MIRPTLSRRHRQCLATAASTSPSAVRLLDAAPRDGLQNEPQNLTEEEKVDFTERLSGAGFSSLEAAAFAHPKCVPQGRKRPAGELSVATS